MEKIKIRFKVIRNGVNFILFALLVCFIFTKVTWLFRGNSSEAREEIAGFRNESSVDVVLFAGSDLLRYYQPMEAWHTNGFTSYNYATTHAKADLLRFYAQDSRKTLEASLYVFNIRTLPLVIQTVHSSSVRNWSDSLPVFSTIRFRGLSSFLFTRNWEEADLPSYYLDIIQYHSSYEKLGYSYQWSYLNTGNIDNIDKGFNCSNDYHPFTEPEIITDRADLTGQQYDALEELLDYCDEENLNALFIVTPYIISASDWLCLNTAGDMIRERGYTFVNFNEFYDEIGLDFETDFYDSGHVNFLGAEKYTAYLADYLVSHYELPDHRGVEDYSNWDEDYEKYVGSQIIWKTEIEATRDSARNARKVGLQLSEISDFEQWYTATLNDNYSLLIVKSSADEWNVESVAFTDFVNNIGMDLNGNNFAGIYSAEEQVYCANDENPYEGSIGIGGASYHIEAGTVPSIIIDGVEYVNSSEGIHIVVFDNNYMDVYDSVTLVQNDENQIELLRE